jgi:hypothetical protein
MTSGVPFFFFWSPFDRFKNVSKRADWLVCVVRVGILGNIDRLKKKKFVDLTELGGGL